MMSQNHSLRKSAQRVHQGLTGNNQPTRPTFIGHYWLEGIPAPLSEKVACVDYSVAENGKLAAYRWNGEQIIRSDAFVWV